MGRQEGAWSRLKNWVGEHPDLERWLRLISPAFLYSALDERLSFREAINEALNKKVPRHALRTGWCMGGTALLLLISQVVTGVLLAVYYKPSPEAAYTSIRYIEQEVAMGWLIRQIHAWGANLMIAFLLLHVIRVFLSKAYRPPRELTWVTGALALFITMAFGFTGYLLPWDQLSYWASTVGSGLADGVPLIGHSLLLLIRAGENVSGLTLARFFAVHTVVLPWAIAAVLLGHFMIIRRLGISRPL
jgi:quinol-cytochrome oxidoreductase complex cytochrome b subunit